MGYVRKETITVTTNGSSASTAYIPADGSPAFNGRLSSIIYSTTATEYSTTVDFTITVEGTGEPVWAQSNVDASATVAPRQATHDKVGVASLYETGQAVEDYYRLADDRIKIVLAQGGVSKTGTFTVIVEK